MWAVSCWGFGGDPLGIEGAFPFSYLPPISVFHLPSPDSTPSHLLNNHTPSVPSVIVTATVRTTREYY
ncbi:hypothetical protein DACRYDRAFT_23882 [Dacryopinax primogenitus]|uniref:Uncharacterized protein n=1 Tax=Dacryopinax primogenitus (strain DJM 731) TaxID=1858805 RepID=M5G0D3_DACPD|nr:uncharacterized protein DACRYDRAFT_23882 [Dacryopinax primogenitus]EJT99291.1 hypothetical protein DACRYDRAFT_23882 [Dacryopinax primogenitus]